MVPGPARGSVTADDLLARRLPGSVGGVLALMHELEEALRLLERAYDERSAYLPQLATSPIWDSVRHDGRFVVLLRAGSPPL